MRIILADGPELVTKSLTRLFEQQMHQVVAVTNQPTELAGLAVKHQPDVCILEVATPREGLIEGAMRSITACASHTDVVVVTGAELSQVRLEALAAGALAVVSKSSHGADLVAQVERRVTWPARKPKQTGRDLYFLTERELQVLAYLASGDSTERISSRLCLSHATVRSHVQSLLSKLGVHSRASAVAAGVVAGLISWCA